MSGKAISLVKIGTLIMMFSTPAWVCANDLSDGIAEYTDDSVVAEDDVGGKDTNINFIVVQAKAMASMEMKSAEKNEGEGTGKETETKSKNITNVNDGKQSTNENSVVVESGSTVDKIYNIIIEK